MARPDAQPNPTNQQYFASLEDEWRRKAEKEKLTNRLVVVQREEARPSDPYRPAEQAAPQYDVLHIDGQGKVKRIGGYSLFDTEALSIAHYIESSGTEGIKLLQKQGFPALLEKAHQPIAATITSLTGGRRPSIRRK